ncbi:hypothetical protein KEM09_14345 [Carboxylicivirga mesophila]|uniref:Methyltransferase n=1 Tax=Carboxylicivirga mesophila TaxID=1166478 RepID=A0ABS5KC28_9BACT|nr:hypothetical protein [Carboxylicivirga mesophila]MBS2212594.1 hypothetical protein [Carboxylicivirga mesophila]
MMIHRIEDRFRLTEQFLHKTLGNASCEILDIGARNRMSEYLLSKDFKVESTHEGIDFDMLNDELKAYEQKEVTTAFEVLEHLFDPMNFLNKIPTDKLILTVPLQLWFSKPYMHVPIKDGGHVAYGHFHEFVIEQLHMVLDKTGWKIIYDEKWKSAPRVPLGIRPLLRYFYPSVYAVYCERTEPYQTGNYKITKPA